MTPIHCRVSSCFEAVADAFASAFEGRPQMGGALAIRHQGREVVSLWGGVADARGVTLLSLATVERATAILSEGPPVFPAEPPYARWGMGFQLDSEARRYLSARSFGHDGAGGQSAFADPEHRIGFAFLTNWMEAGEDRRATNIIDALRCAVST